MRSLRAVEEWPVDNVAVAVVDAKGTVLGAHGSGDLPFKLASVTKMLTAYTVLIAVEEGAIEWDYPVGPPGSTLRHLIAHASGLSYDKPEAVAEPGRRRLYSNAGYNLIAETIASVTGISFTDYAREAVFTPLHMYSTVLDGSAAASGVSTCSDLTKFAAELQAPTLVSEAMMAEATTVAFPGLSGVLPGLGYRKNNDWGLGFELRRIKRDEVFDADELLLSSATKEVLAITRLDGKPVGAGMPGPVYARLYAGYQQAKIAQSK